MTHFSSSLWLIKKNDTSAVVATAIHDGHAMRSELMPYLAINEATRLREEDPFTGEWARCAPTWVVAHNSRFEVDLNRPRDKAIYHTPADAWGLQVWHTPLPAPLIARSLATYDTFYEQMHRLFTHIIEQHGQCVVFDIHSYCHHRNGQHAAPADPALNPTINVGTSTMNRTRWQPLLSRVVSTLQQHTLQGEPLDVRENVKFSGGHFARWLHSTYGNAMCVFSLEIKKVFMDEWSGEQYPTTFAELTTALTTTLHDVDAFIATHTS